MPPPLRPTNEIWNYVRLLRRDVDRLLRRGQIVKVPYSIKLSAEDAAPVAGDGAFVFTIDYDAAGLQLRSVVAYVTTVSTSGLTTFQVRNATDAVDMLSTRVTIDVGEYNSSTAATPVAINAGNATVSALDRIAIDIDSVGTGVLGAGILLVFS